MNRRERPQFDFLLSLAVPLFTFAITAIYMVITWGIFNTTSETLKTTKEISIVTNRPMVYLLPLSGGPTDQGLFVSWSYKNFGTLPAFNLKTMLRFSKNKKEEIPLITNTVQSMCEPGRVLPHGPSKVELMDHSAIGSSGYIYCHFYVSYTSSSIEGGFGLPNYVFMGTYAIPNAPSGGDIKCLGVKEIISSASLGDSLRLWFCPPDTFRFERLTVLGR